MATHGENLIFGHRGTSSRQYNEKSNSAVPSERGSKASGKSVLLHISKLHAKPLISLRGKSSDETKFVIARAIEN